MHSTKMLSHMQHQLRASSACEASALLRNSITALNNSGSSRVPRMKRGTDGVSMESSQLAPKLVQKPRRSSDAMAFGLAKHEGPVRDVNLKCLLESTL